MKILHVTPSYEPAWHLGGVVRSVSQLCRGLAGLGHEVTVFTTDNGLDRRLEVPLNRPMELGGVKVYYFRTDFSLSYGFSRSLTMACRQSFRSFDIVHLTSFWCYPQIPARAAARRDGVPYLVSVRGTIRQSALKNKSWKKWLYYQVVEKWTSRQAAAIHYTTQMERGMDSFHGFSNPSFIIPNGFEAQEFCPAVDRQEARRFWQIPPDAKVVAFLGRLHPVKALDLLVKACGQLQVSEIPIQLLLAGPDGGMEAPLRILVQNLKLESRVRFLGMLNGVDRNRLLAASDLLALISHDENFGNAAVEAMLAGVPVLVSEHVGICREVAADGAGRVVPLKVEAVAQALQQMLADPEKLQAMGQVAAGAARRRYDLTIVARQMATAYEDILLGRRSSGLSWSDA